MTNSAFIFENYRFDAATGILHLHYRYENGAAFEEKILFPGNRRDLNKEESAAFDAACRLIFISAGVSYYKAYVPRDLKCAAFPLDHATAAFASKLYLHGLGEFAYQNKLDLSGKINFIASDAPAPHAVRLNLPQHLLVPVGGGKDSIVSLELLKQAGSPITLYAQAKAADNLPAPIAATIEISGLPALKVGRILSPNLIELNKTGALNGHVPITAILSAITVACAILYGFDTIILSNEYSASAPNLKIDELEVNHQYSKSLEFESDLSAYIDAHISPDIRYFSLLRPLTEVAIARRFARHEKYHAAFRSCNTVFRQDAARRGKNWCCDCPKCRFVFLALAPFVAKPHLVEIFGKDMLDDNTQKLGFSELCGLTAYKPFECVGEIEESALLMQKLMQLPEWQNDKIVRQLGPQIAAQDFEDRYKDLFTLRPTHRVPPDFLELLHADR